MEKKFSTYAIVTTYVGTAFGAGFISGQELLQFFFCDVSKSIVAVIVMALCIFLFSLTIMNSSHSKQTDYYEKLIVGESTILRKLVMFFFYIFTFGIIVVMVAGAGALLNSLFDVPKIYGNLIMAFLVLIIGISGPEGIMKSFSLLTPFMFVIVIVCSILGLNLDPSKFVEGYTTMSCPGGNWITGAIIYVTYNYYIAIAVLTYLGKDAKSRKDIFFGSFISAIVLGLCTGLIIFALLHNYGLMIDEELPMLAISTKVNGMVGNAYALMIFCALLAASIGMLYAILNVLKTSKNKFINNKMYTVPAMCFVALLFSNIGFSDLIAVLYPFIGYCGIFAMIGVFVQFFRMKFKQKNDI